MKIFILALVMLVVSVTSIVSPSTNLQMSWANWILMDWAPSWPYTTWTKPALPTGYQKKVFSKNDPGANNRSWHYGYDNVDGTSSIYCGPESYLSPNFKCKRNPYYWDFAKVSTECDPDQVVLGLRRSCESQGKTTCCYKTNQGDLYSYSVTSTSYPLVSP